MSIRQPVTRGSRDSGGRQDSKHYLTVSRNKTGNADRHCVPALSNRDCRPRTHARLVRFDWWIILGESEPDIKRRASSQCGNAANAPGALLRWGGESSRRFLSRLVERNEAHARCCCSDWLQPIGKLSTQILLWKNKRAYVWQRTEARWARV